nr:hypothetical protein CFP56_23859 [Quercus suber]
MSPAVRNIVRGRSRGASTAFAVVIGRVIDLDREIQHSSQRMLCGPGNLLRNDRKRSALGNIQFVQSSPPSVTPQCKEGPGDDAASLAKYTYTVCIQVSPSTPRDLGAILRLDISTLSLQRVSTQATAPKANRSGIHPAWMCQCLRTLGRG